MLLLWAEDVVVGADAVVAVAVVAVAAVVAVVAVQGYAPREGV